MRFNFNKIAFCFLGLFLTLILASDAFCQSKVKNKSKTKITVKQQIEEEKRKEIESRMLKGEYQHDGSGELLYIGTIESVPALLKVLEDNPPNETNGKKFYICTYAHAISALKKITGQSFVDFQDWKNWWEKYQKEKESQR